jgi:hypothetical protein
MSIEYRRGYWWDAFNNLGWIGIIYDDISWLAFEPTKLGYEATDFRVGAWGRAITELESGNTYVRRVIIIKGVRLHSVNTCTLGCLDLIPQLAYYQLRLAI